MISKLEFDNPKKYRDYGVVSTTLDWEVVNVLINRAKDHDLGFNYVFIELSTLPYIVTIDLIKHILKQFKKTDYINFKSAIYTLYLENAQFDSKEIAEITTHIDLYTLDLLAKQKELEERERKSKRRKKNKNDYK